MSDRISNVRLRGVIDPKDPASFRLKKLREGSRPIPDWTQHDAKVQEVLRACFPKLKTSEWQRQRAMRWNQVIHYRWRLNLTVPRIVEEINSTPSEAGSTTAKSVEHILKRCQIVAQGLFADPDHPLRVSTRGTPRRKRGGARPGAGRIRTNVVTK